MLKKVILLLGIMCLTGCKIGNFKIIKLSKHLKGHLDVQSPKMHFKVLCHEQLKVLVKNKERFSYFAFSSEEYMKLFNFLLHILNDIKKKSLFDADAVMTPPLIRVKVITNNNIRDILHAYKSAVYFCCFDEEDYFAFATFLQSLKIKLRFDK